MLRQIARAVVPRSARLAVSHLLSNRESDRARDELEAMGRRTGPVIVGPWIGEVGFELLYWIPFLQWAVRAGRIDRARIVVVSRGGPASWYRHIADRYADVFDFLTPEEFQSRNRERHGEVGEQKQVRSTSLEEDLVGRVSKANGLQSPDVLHPGLMYRVMNPYWWGHRQADWIERHAEFRTLQAGTTADIELPDDYTAVKFYFNECFPATAENRAAATRLVRTLADEGAVVSLATGLRLDDHHAWDEEEGVALAGIRSAVTPATNLAFQTTVVAGAKAWAGTYGGFAYLAPFHGVPARALYSDAAGFSRRHLDLAQRVFARFGPDLLQLAHA